MDAAIFHLEDSSDSVSAANGGIEGCRAGGSDNYAIIGHCSPGR